MENNYKHALVIGGTGMMSDVSLFLANKSNHTTVMARNEHRLNELLEEAKSKSSSMDVISVDYSDTSKLISLIKNSLEKYGHIDIIVAWIHSSAPDVAKAIVTEISKSGSSKFFHVLGSMSSDPKRIKPNFDVSEFSNIVYYKVILGSIIEDRKHRWLTNKEISKGIIYAIENNISEYIVGQQV